MYTLEALGWSEAREHDFQTYREQGLVPGRIAIENRERYSVLGERGELIGEVAGRLLFSTDSPAELPKVGDWVAMSPFPEERKAIIHAVLPRRSKFSRKVAGSRAEEQVVAANIDVVFIVQGLDGNFNVPRLERYLVMVYEGGASPMIILNKLDLCDAPEACVAAAGRAAPGVPVLAVSAIQKTGLEALRECLAAGRTYAFIGSSGVGKSTLINELAGQALFEVGEVREKNARGRHTTTRRELVLLPAGGLLIDTPGMRELQLWESMEGLEDTFADLAAWAEKCHFTDCRHEVEKGCAILHALENGQLPLSRYQSFMKLQKELELLEQRRSRLKMREKKRKEKVMHRAMKRMQQNRPKFE